MGEGDAGCRRPPYAREQLKRALLAHATDPDKRPAVPFIYALDQLAQRWHVHPADLERDPVWLIRGLEFMRLEASVTTSSTTKRPTP